MARETTIKFNFQLEKSKRTAAILETPGVTKGATTVINVSGTDPGWAAGYYAPGQLLYISDSNLPSLDGKLHMITASAVGTETVTVGTDTSGDTETAAAFGDINVQAIEWSDVCLTEFTPSPGAPGEIDVTTMCDEERVNLPGLAAPGTASFTGIFDYDDAGMQDMIAAKKDAAARFFVGTSRLGQVFIYHGVVSSFSPGPMTVEAALTFTGTFTLDQSPYYYKQPV
jgi:hypothetical protein